MTTQLRGPTRPRRPKPQRADLGSAGATTVVTTSPTSGSSNRVDRLLLTSMAVAVWGAVVVIGRAWGLLLESQGRQITLYTPPVLGGYRTSVDERFLLPIAVGGALVMLLPWSAERLRWSALVVWSAVGAVGWWVALALIDGPDGLTHGLEWDADYRDAIPAVIASPRAFLSGFVDHLPTASIQVRAHPPGLPLVLAGLDHVGLHGPGWAAVLVLASATSGVAAVLIAVRAVTSEETARRAAPFVVLAPAAIWIATSFDALYVGVAAWSVASLLLAVGATGTRRIGLAVASGLLAAAALLLSYGLILMACVVVFVAWRQRQWAPVAVAAGTAALGIAAFVPLGYWYGSGLVATRQQYYALGLDRPYPYFLVDNLSALALVLGPALAVALVRLRDRRLWLLVGGALLAVALADVSGLSKGEVERIWLPFAVWILPAGAVLATAARPTRGWLALQVTSALVLSAFINTYW